MTKPVRFEWNFPGFVQLRKSPQAVADLTARAARIAAQATANAEPGAVFGHDVILGRNRARAMIWTDTFQAVRAEATTRALTRAIDASRG